MKTSSPLRYPGGKSAMASLLCQIRKLNELGDRAIAEPFAGGAGASLTLLYLEETPEIYINDADHAIYDFWWSVINQSKQFASMISDTCVSITEWRHQREIYRSRNYISPLYRGFSTFYLNRCNRSGIIKNGGPIGGLKQEGKWKLDARFNKVDLIRRCKKVAEYGDRIHVSKYDGIKFLNNKNSRNIFYFIDPPYFSKGKMLYLDKLDSKYHFNLGEKLKSMIDASWVLTYDDCPEVRKIYKDWAIIRPFDLRYAAAKRRSGKEVLITPKWMRLPTSQTSAAISW